ncbi:MAG: murein hydrolase effector protein LrgB [Oceanospirillaceae bacterium]|mgnify:CR=1 FL=1|uniref:LrgB family protein n=1 Tax=unclassified Thalassolituus TaxID=2624967 RepID=UPI000C623FB7|nr:MULTISPECIES: LrgB family protein [unclassified Thalassolituus]MBL34858.1 murein hydrolase effector protein LrgB [Oceanospirillaceae bacterium]MBS51652.1 murein hydrolase effector protein LrgB [Oceanospirillaceae bacterium]|tara:strand:- start:52 stop:741 length:690 start_codon:yes stop_codon:yes gene_type:complete
MPDTLAAIVSLAATIGIYYLAKALYRRKPIFIFTPILFTPIAVIALVLGMKIPLNDYFALNHYLVLMLGPATIAFALPIYQQRKIITRYPVTLAAGVIFGLFAGVLSSWILVQLFPMPEEIAHSMLTRSVSTPFAMQATLAFGGVPDMAAILVLITGITGMLLCDPVFRMAGIRTSHARGAALGAASHGAGTAKAHQLGSEEGVIASLTMTFTGVAMVLSAPWLSSLLG